MIETKTPTTLDELVNIVLDIELKDPDPDNSLAKMLMADCKFDTDEQPITEPTTVVAGLAVGPGRAIAAMARLLIAKCEPSCAVLALPSFMAKLPLGQSLETYGVNKVRDLPDDLRYDSLVIHGEDAIGNTVVQMYVIERDNEGKRVWVKQNDNWTKIQSRFEHLFVLPGLMRESGPMAEILKLPEDQVGPFAKQAALMVLSRAMQAAIKQSSREDNT